MGGWVGGWMTEHLGETLQGRRRPTPLIGPDLFSPPALLGERGRASAVSTGGQPRAAACPGATEAAVGGASTVSSRLRRGSASQPGWPCVTTKPTV